MVTAVDLREVRELHSDDKLGLSIYLQQLIGHPFLFFRQSYADEMMLHLGTPIPAHPKLKRRVRGAYVLTFRGSLWTLLSGPHRSLTIADPFLIPPPGSQQLELKDLEKSPPVTPGARVVLAMPFFDKAVGGFGLALGFSDESTLMLRPSPTLELGTEGEELPEIADWELFTPYGRYIKVGPGPKWGYLSSEKKAPADGDKPPETCHRSPRLASCRPD